MEVSKADMIVSLAGRDKGQLFFVVDTDEQLCLPRRRQGTTAGKPEAQKAHGTSGSCPLYASRVAEKIRNGDKVLNSELRRELAVYRPEHSIVKTKGVN